MAKDIETKTIEIKRTERTWRTELFSDYGTDYTLVAHREIISTDPEGNKLSSEREGSYVFPLSELSNKDLGGMTGAEFAQKISEVIDALVEEKKNGNEA